MKIIFFLTCNLFIISLFIGCQNKLSKQNFVNNSTNKVSENNVSKIINELKNAKGQKVLVAAHRGDWRNAPENSLQAITNCIKMGIDIVEIDICLTRDSIPVLMHDLKINRTTNGKGLVSEYTYDSLQNYYLKDGLGRITKQKIPTLEQALLIAKNNIVLNLDKCYDIFPVIIPILQRTHTLNQVLMKGSVDWGKFNNDLSGLNDSLLFMPVINLDDLSADIILKSYLQNKVPCAFELNFSADTSIWINKFIELKNKGARVWINSLTPNLNAGHDDELALTDIPNSYDWIIKEKKANIIQTDRPELLLKYLKSLGLHD